MTWNVGFSTTVIQFVSVQPLRCCVTGRKLITQRMNLCDNVFLLFFIFLKFPPHYFNYIPTLSNILFQMTLLVPPSLHVLLTSYTFFSFSFIHLIFHQICNFQQRCSLSICPLPLILIVSSSGGLFDPSLIGPDNALWLIYGWDQSNSDKQELGTCEWVSICQYSCDYPYIYSSHLAEVFAQSTVH